MEYRSISANELAGACSDSGNERAWSEFVRRFQRPIALVVLRTARGWGACSTLMVDDLVQETFLRLCAENCKLLKSFVSREPDSIVGYLKVIAANVTHDHFRSEKSGKRGGHLRRVESDRDDTEYLFASPDQADAAEKAVQMEEIDQALRSFVPDQLTERDRTIFWLYYQQGFSARDISAIASVGLTVKGVESSIHRSTRQVREALRPASGEYPAMPKGISTAATILKEEE